MTRNLGLIFRKVPSGAPVAGQDIVVEDRPIDLDSTNVPEGGLLLHTQYHSFDPYQRGRLRPANIKSYSPAYEIGKPLTNSGIGKVVKSANDKFKEGDVVISMMATEEYTILEKDAVNSGRVRKLDNQYGLDEKMFLGALGMPGLTAYSSFYEIGKPKKGETIFVSAASGAVGQLVGQLAKHEGLKVIGSVGDDKKLDFIIKELGFDGGFNYKKEKPSEALARLAPNGIDIYYENVGGEQLEAAIEAMNQFGRIVACGMISQYNASSNEERYGVRNLFQFVAKRLTMQGFIVGDENMGPRHIADHQKNVQKWIHEGTFKAQMSTTEGMKNAAEGFVGMLRGDNFGKAVLVVDAE